MNDLRFSVLMSVYFRESPVFLRESLQSVVTQTTPASEIILVIDGPVSRALNEVINEYCTAWPGLFKIIALPKNKGLGHALNVGLAHCSNEIIARMDTDDIALKERFECQLKYLEKNQDVIAVGSYLEEFKDFPGDFKHIKKVPLNHDALKRFARKRNPLNHPSVMFRKTPVFNVGGYEQVLYFEDYYLWLKLLRNGFQLANIEKVLLHFRIGNDMIGRRIGYGYAGHEINFFFKAYRDHLIGIRDAITAIALRTPLRLTPKKLLTLIYTVKLRKNETCSEHIN